MKVIAIYPGRFHPFHKGHASSFKQLAQKFGLDNTYLAISAKQEQPKSPFSAQDRAKMATSLGIPSKNILAVRNPYGAQEYIDQLNLDPEQTAIIFGVSKKDMEGDPAMGIPPDPRFGFKPKKDGSPSYLQPFTPKKIDPMSQHGYIMSTDVAEFPIAGKPMRDASSIRSAYAGADQETKMRILTDLYGDAAEKIKPVFDNNLQVTESIRRLINKIKPMLGEATIQQKAKFVKLLSEAKAMISEKPGDVYSKGQAGIIEDLGNGYFLGDDSYYDDEGFSKTGYSVYKQVGDNSFRMVGSVQMSPYKNPPGHVENEIERLIAQDQSVSEAEEKSGIEQAYNDPETHSILAYAQQRYPEEPNLQAAFVKFVLRSLRHSEEDDQRQDVEIDYVQGKLRSIEKDLKGMSAQKDNKVTENQDYLDEK